MSKFAQDHDAVRRHLLTPLGSIDPLPRQESADATVARNQWRFSEFESLRRNRQVFGRHRYEIPTNDLPHKQVESAIDRLRRYLLDGNKEHLVDAANLCALEFVNPGSHPNPRLVSSDDGEHVDV